MAEDKAVKTLKRVQTFGKKKTATAVATVTRSSGCDIRVNGIPVSQILPATLRVKILEPVHFIGSNKFRHLKVKVTVRGGGPVSQAYAARQAIAKGLVAFYQKYSNEVEKSAIKNAFLEKDKTLLVTDPRRCETKKSARHSARSRFTKSLR